MKRSKLEVCLRGDGVKAINSIVNITLTNAVRTIQDSTIVIVSIHAVVTYGAGCTRHL